MERGLFPSELVKGRRNSTLSEMAFVVKGLWEAAGQGLSWYRFFRSATSAPPPQEGATRGKQCRELAVGPPGPPVGTEPRPGEMALDCGCRWRSPFYEYSEHEHRTVPKLCGSWCQELPSHQGWDDQLGGSTPGELYEPVPVSFSLPFESSTAILSPAQCGRSWELKMA